MNSKNKSCIFLPGKNTGVQPAAVAAAAAAAAAPTASIKVDNAADFTLAAHCVKLKKSGTFIDIDQLYDMSGKINSQKFSGKVCCLNIFN